MTDWQVREKVNSAWRMSTYHLRQIYRSIDVRPTNPADIFTVDRNAPDDLVKLLVRPVVFYLSERAGQPAQNLFIVVCGWLSFEKPDSRTAELRTHDFGTQVAYFRRKGIDNDLEYIFGAHYDMDGCDYRHPVFHVQLSSHMEFFDTVKEEFSQLGKVTNELAKEFRGVRIPTAQMDVFSVLIQICADHLIGEAPSEATTSAFGKMKRATDFFVGAGHKLTYLNGPRASGCYRGTHWYDL